MLTLSGVLKDILLVVASMAIFGDPVTGQQYMGYSVALAGLVYYKLGADKMQSLATDARLWIGEARQTHPARVKFLVLGAVASVILLGWWFGLGSGTAARV